MASAWRVACLYSAIRSGRLLGTRPRALAIASSDHSHSPAADQLALDGIRELPGLGSRERTHPLNAEGSARGGEPHRAGVQSRGSECDVLDVGERDRALVSADDAPDDDDSVGGHDEPISPPPDRPQTEGEEIRGPGPERRGEAVVDDLLARLKSQARDVPWHCLIHRCLAHGSDQPPFAGAPSLACFRLLPSFPLPAQPAVLAQLLEGLEFV